MMPMSNPLENFVTLSSFVMMSMIHIMTVSHVKMKNFFITSGKDSGELLMIMDSTKK